MEQSRNIPTNRREATRFSRQRELWHNPISSKRFLESVSIPVRLQSSTTPPCDSTKVRRLFKKKGKSPSARYSSNSIKNRSSFRKKGRSPSASEVFLQCQLKIINRFLLIISKSSNVILAPVPHFSHWYVSLIGNYTSFSGKNTRYICNFELLSVIL